MTRRRASIQKFLAEHPDIPDDAEIDLRDFLGKEQAAALHKNHPVPKDDKARRHLGRLDRLIRFYREKTPTAPEQQQVMFRGFIGALVYAVGVIKMYRNLTQQLAEIAEEDDDAPVNTIE
jgi:hypothetical protein